MTVRLSTASRNASTDAVVDRCDLGGAGSIEIRSGSQPASAEDAASGTLLATITMSATAFGSSATGVATLAGTPLSATAAATGTAGWARVKNGSGATVMDVSVTATSGGGDIELASTSIVSGATVRITSGSYTTPA